MPDQSPSYQSPLVIVLSIIAAVFGVRAFQPGEPKSAPKDGLHSAAEAGKKAPGGDDAGGAAKESCLQPLVEFIQTTTRQSVDSSRPLRQWQLPKDYNLTFLIATLPDPLNSTSGWRFDSHVDAIQRAVETQGFVLDRWYYPWRQTAGPNEIRGTAKRPFESEPGTLLFRGIPNHKNEKQLLLVFLVGETATQGIHKKAFATCLDHISLCYWHNSYPLRVLGPAFSGSRASLEIALGGWKPPLGGFKPGQINIVSGTASTIRKVEFVNALQKALEPSKVEFHSCLWPESTTLDVLLKYVETKSYQEKNNPPWTQRVALLTESNTAFGKNALADLKSDLKKQGEPSKPSPKREPSKTFPKETQILSLPFPLHVSDVRTAYSKEKGTKNDPTAQLPSFGTRLQIPLEESGSPIDTEPSLTPTLTTVETEQILGKILTSISQQRIAYVIISATDLKDKLFLAALIREYCPDVQLLLSGSDILLTHPNYCSDLRGTIVASAYPLYLPNQRWTYPFEGNSRLLLFPGQQEQGYYNATIALLADECPGLDKMLDYGIPFVNEDSCERRPPVWISILG
jgi:hypothetical protein